MADKKSLNDNEISKVTGGYGGHNFQRNIGQQVYIDSNNPKCPNDGEELNFKFQVGFAKQELYSCPKCYVNYVKDWVESWPERWFIDEGTDS